MNQNLFASDDRALAPPSNATPRRLAAIPTYERIEQELRARVAAGEWGDGVILPSRRELAADYNVDLNTLQRAVAPLLSDGTLRAQGRRGTFVGANAPKDGAPPQDKQRLALPVLSVGIIWRIDRDSRDGYRSPVVAGIERATSARGGMCRTFDLGNETSSDRSLARAVDALMGQGAAGIVNVIDRPDREVEELFSVSAARRVPIVYAGPVPSRCYRLSVTFSQIDAGFQAARHLFRKGCRDLLIFSGRASPGWRQREQGALEAASAFGVGREALVRSVDDSVSEDAVRSDRLANNQTTVAYVAAAGLLRRGLPAQGVVALSEYDAYGFIRAAGDLGYVAGTDYAITGFDDLPEATVAGLTTICPPLEAIGREAVALLARSLNDPSLAMQAVLPSELVSRASTMTYVAGGRGR